MIVSVRSSTVRISATAFGGMAMSNRSSSAITMSMTVSESMVVPSLINRWEVLDLTAEKSLLRGMAAQGLRPYLVDWGTPDANERTFDLAAYIGRLERALAFVARRAQRAPAVMGYCMGGGYALTAAGTFPSRVAAAASFHGGWLATEKTDSPHRLAAQMRAQLYVGVAGIDPMFPPEECERLRAALEAEGCAFELKVYEGVRHGFSVTGHPVYDRTASEEHWQVLARFFPKVLKA